MNIFEYYGSHGAMTDPKEYIQLYGNLSPNLGQLAKIISQVTIHFQYIRESGGKEVVGRIHEIYIRKTSERLKRMSELGITSFQQEYPFLQRTICTCRDIAMLLCSMLRHFGIPARIRYGFAQYLDWDPHFFFDHTIVEYWDADRNMWKLTERYLTKEIKQRFNITFNTYDVPREKFITAAEAWLNCRAGKSDPNSFGTGYAKRRSGLWYLRNKLIQDLAGLNKMEMQPSDLWGLMIDAKDNKIRHLVSADEALLMDDIAICLTNSEENLNALQKFYINNTFLRIEKNVCRVRMNGKYFSEEI